MNLIITGIRGIPGSHGGFETFAEYLALFLKKENWNVTVYCQEDYIKSSKIYESHWNGIKRFHIPIKQTGALGTIIFDFKTIIHAANQPGTILTLGYNTALFNLYLKFFKKKIVLNMDGIEWKRDKWKFHERVWLFLNEFIGAKVGNILVADNPEIKNHLLKYAADSKIKMIPYGARQVENPDVNYIHQHGLISNNFSIIIARAEPENSILDIVTAFSKRKRNSNLVVLGNYDKNNKYHADVIKAASDEVIFLGAIYNHDELDALRYYSKLYIHGHTVGGTNPSLVEAMGSGQAILAHDNKFNRWVAGDGAIYFHDIETLSKQLDCTLDNTKILTELSSNSSRRFHENFKWSKILNQYKKILES